MSQGVYVIGGKCPGGKCPGVTCPGGGVCPRTLFYTSQRARIKWVKRDVYIGQAYGCFNADVCTINFHAKKLEREGISDFYA